MQKIQEIYLKCMKWSSSVSVGSGGGGGGGSVLVVESDSGSELASYRGKVSLRVWED